MHLLDWKEVLNIVDEYIELIIKTWRKEIILEKESNVLPNNVNPTYYDDISDLKCLLEFTSNVLGNCVQKDVYNSTEVRKCKLYFNGCDTNHINSIKR